MIAMRKTCRILLWVLPAALLAGCLFIPDTELYNQTGKDLVITTCTLVDKTNYEVTFTIKDKQTAKIGVPYKMKVQFGGMDYYYSVKPIPLEFYESVGGNKRVAKLQIQENARIYL